VFKGLIHKFPLSWRCFQIKQNTLRTTSVYNTYCAMCHLL